jgi:hypothetical protein
VKDSLEGCVIPTFNYELPSSAFFLIKLLALIETALEETISGVFNLLNPI